MGFDKNTIILSQKIRLNFQKKIVRFLRHLNVTFSKACVNNNLPLNHLITLT